MNREIDKHRAYIRDAAKVHAFGAALRQVVSPGAIVLDLGCGSGILGLLACQAGARTVYAVDRGPIINVARELAQENGFADRIRFFPHVMADAPLPTPVDIVVGDQLGPLGIGAGLPDLFSAAAARWLVPGGHLLPGSFTTYLALVSAPEQFQSEIDAWLPPQYGLTFDATRRHATERIARLQPPVTLLAGPEPLWTVDLKSAASPLTGTAQLTVTAAGECHGLCGWFEAALTPDITLTNAPDHPGRVNRPLGWLPWPAPVSVQEGDTIEAALTGTSSALSWQIRGRRGTTRLFERTGSTLGSLILPPAPLSSNR